jgi:hypothetical protein
MNYELDEEINLEIGRIEKDLLQVGPLQKTHVTSYRLCMAER